MTLHEQIAATLSSYASAQIVIFGLEREGISTYRFLRQHLPSTQLILTDERPLESLSDEVKDSCLVDEQTRFIPAHELAAALPSGSSISLFKSAGIPHTNQVISDLKKQHSVTVTSNTQFFLSLLHSLPTEHRPLTIGVTGTKGKSTTTALTFAVCKATDRPCFLAGNIGEPALNLLTDMTQLDATAQRESIVVLELSSHQLQHGTVSPHIAVLQNITPEHLDYYPDFATYCDAKAEITRHQTSDDILICNPSFAEPLKIAEASQAQKWYYSLEETNAHKLRAVVKDDTVLCQDTPVISIVDIPLQGMHNVLNTMPAVMIGVHLDLVPNKIAAVIKQFSALPHRLQFVATKNNVEYYNDSQGTTPEAVMAAVQSFADKEIVLLAGGSDKGIDFTELAAFLIQQKISEILLFPPTGEKIAAAVLQAAEDAELTPPTLTPVSSMPEAVQKAATTAQPGNIVLLSPACASFGLFKNYQDRGNQFMEAVQKLP